MRKFKFRIWDKEKKRMLLPELLTISFSYEDIGFLTYQGEPHFAAYLDYDKYEIMQFIDRCDKNNKEIYEGDIVKINRVHWSNDTVNSIVQWYSEDACFILFAKDEIIHFMTHNLSDYEVIGNIYENADLLKGEK